MEEVLAFKRLYKAMKARRVFNLDILQSTWINLAFSFEGLKKLTPEAALFGDLAFKEGMHRRSMLLGDPVDEASEGHCTKWVVGAPSNVPDAVLIIGSDNKERLQTEVEAIESDLEGALLVIHKEQGSAPPAPLSAHEHFGFRDGISQPGVRGRVSDARDDFLTPRENPVDPNQGKPGQDLVWPGEFVFGYLGQSPTEKTAPGEPVEAGPRWAKDGSFLVFRRYRQDVGRFRNFLEATAEKLKEEVPALADMTPEKLGAKLAGRWFSGAPILRAPDRDNPEIAEDPCADNNFKYARRGRSLTRGASGLCADDKFPPSPADDVGLICPHAAHIRKAFPRDDLGAGVGEAAAHTHRLIRRGIPFGTSTRGECGLLFLAYQTSFERQFEFVVGRWLNNPDFRDRNVGHDPIVGQSGMLSRRRTFKLPVRGGDGVVTDVILDLPDDWTIPTGGGYFFAPSISALRYLSVR